MHSFAQESHFQVDLPNVRTISKFVEIIITAIGLQVSFGSTRDAASIQATALNSGSIRKRTQELIGSDWQTLNLQSQIKTFKAASKVDSINTQILPKFMRVNGPSQELIATEETENSSVKKKQTTDKNYAPTPEMVTKHIELLRQLKERNKGKINGKDTVSDATNRTSIKSTSLDDPVIRDLLRQTSTGSFLSFAYDQNPKKTPSPFEQLFERALKAFLQNIPENQIEKRIPLNNSLANALKCQNFQRTYHEVYGLLKDILIQTLPYSQDYYTFWHNHGNELRLYNDMLKKFMAYKQFKEFGNTSTNKSINNVADFLKLYESKILEESAEDSFKAEKYVPGVRKAPDSFTFPREHLLSVTIQFFGNTNLLAENSLFYFLNSFNTSTATSNSFLIKRLLKDFFPEASEMLIVNIAKQFYDLYNEYFNQAGETLTAIHIKKSEVDNICFPSWTEGIPIWLDKKTLRLATHNEDNHKALPLLWNENNEFIRPLASDYIDLYSTNPQAFVRKYSIFDIKTFDRLPWRKIFDCIDRPQMRMVVIPNIISDTSKVKFQYFTRRPIPQEYLNEYYKKLDMLVQKTVHASFILDTIAALKSENF